MRLGVELFDISEGRTGGLVPLLQGVLESLFARWPDCKVTLFGTAANKSLFPSVPSHVQFLALPREGFFQLLDVYASCFQLDVLLRSYPGDADLVFPMERQAVLIPDMQHEFYPEFFSPEVLEYRRSTFAKALLDAGAIATISEHARATLVRHSTTRCRDIFLMSPALRTEWEQPSLHALTDAERSMLPTGDFFIYPANLWPHKNHRRVLQAFALFLKRAEKPVEFIFTGHPEGWDTLKGDFPELPIRHLGFVRRGFLQVLLARSRGLLFFSLFEGFGMPLLEAFAAGTPVACSNTTSLPEVGGDAVLTCDPNDPAAMSDLMIRLHQDQDLRERLTDRGKEQLTRFSWQASAAALIAGCKRVHQRAKLLTEAPVLAIDRLNQFLEFVQADRAARLDMIQQLHATSESFRTRWLACHDENQRLHAKIAESSYHAVSRVLRRSLTRLFRAG
jgi:glycosyltransferase involved in cell wall biosynthesis